MNNPWRLFLVGEALLFLLALWQIMSNPPLLLLLFFGIFNIVLVVLKKKKRTHFNNFQLVFGGVIVFISLLSSSAMWMMLVLAIVFIGLKGVELSGIDLTKNTFWRKKQMIMVVTKENQPHSGERKKHHWFGNERIGNQAYEWEDINLDLVSGDTIVDLGNTLLPKKDSVIIIRKGIGRTRILVPLGIAVSLDHSALLGNVLFEGEEQMLKNEQVKMYSNDYDENPRRLKIITNTLLGDVEVIRI
ncbi:hypothetical protein BAU15_06725 [Enterococcus sp. JM4C]|uniref:cell wall-active antibiotics response protein LiaF n=1 Tax=Candidatus Enterococcus huntleyi TaxID=1857217 RepID=UPI001379A7E7|nr:cell wall-active antibiotics response protein LiaF [Enterococcus sp. JM4C]KAF1297236.1 hypothetical protein BAU15_06725 [Enterococcus sp. JM4C]